MMEGAHEDVSSILSAAKSRPLQHTDIKIFGSPSAHRRKSALSLLSLFYSFPLKSALSVAFGNPGNSRLKAAVNWAGSGGRPTLRQGVSLMALYQSGKGAYEAE
jgi:hypothetical protein